MRKYDKLTCSDKKVGGLIFVQVYGVSDGDSYLIGSYYAATYKEACETFSKYEEKYKR